MPAYGYEFYLPWSTQYLTRSLRSLVRYRVDHSKIKFISTRGHVISSIYPTSIVPGGGRKNISELPKHTRTVKIKHEEREEKLSQ